MKNNLPITVAMPKGRLLKPSVELFERAGFSAKHILNHEKSRKLIFEGEPGYVIIRPGDVANYVYHGSADVGIVGNDILLEHPVDVYDFLDLKFGFCRMVLAGVENQTPAKTDDLLRSLRQARIATKYPNILRRWAEKKGLDIEIRPLNGSVEIAPQTGFADYIVDLVESGKTLKENGLVEISTLVEVTSRLIVNRSSLKTCDRIRHLIRTLKTARKS